MKTVLPLAVLAAAGLATAHFYPPVRLFAMKAAGRSPVCPMDHALKADENQLIKYTLSGYDILDGTASPSAFTANTTGTLVVAGQEKPIAMKINAERLSDGKAVAQGEQKLRMSDFGISPPSFMFGRLKVGDQIKVKFNLKAGPELLAQLAAVFNRVAE